MIPFNKPFFCGKELQYIQDAVSAGKISGNGMFTKKCHAFFEEKYHFKKVLLTTSCTDALEMAAILCDLNPGDEVIAPSYTFVSTVNPFVLRGARIIFCDVYPTHPNMDHRLIEELITERTRVIVLTHYAGVACDMDAISAIAEKHSLIVVEDAAHAIDSCYKSSPLAGIGHLGAFSFHETKNLISGEGGMLVINDASMIERAEVLWEKGTNRTRFFRGEIQKYEWVDIGSSFLPSDIIAAFLFAQLENLQVIQDKRKQIWLAYQDGLKGLEERGLISLPYLPDHATNNAHMFYIILPDIFQRDALIAYLSKAGIMAIFHYVPLHSSKFYSDQYGTGILPRTDYYAERLLRLPMFFELGMNEVSYIIQIIKEYYA
jgi:dTDP-4-amino-4,6-dideoxygalactose transaminase